MRKSFNIEYNGRVYVCEFTRNILKKIEADGLLKMTEDGLLSKADALFYGALIKNQPEVTYEMATKILEDLTTADENGESEYSYTEISKALSEMFTATFGMGTKAKKSIM